MTRNHFTVYLESVVSLASLSLEIIFDLILANTQMLLESNVILKVYVAGFSFHKAFQINESKDDDIASSDFVYELS